MATHTLTREKRDGKFVPSALGVPAPTLKLGSWNKPKQGGHPPVPYRQHSGNWSRANKFARVPSNLAPWKD
jgi:hypothetical protein